MDLRTTLEELISDGHSAKSIKDATDVLSQEWDSLRELETTHNFIYDDEYDRFMRKNIHDSFLEVLRHDQIVNILNFLLKEYKESLLGNKGLKND